MVYVITLNEQFSPRGGGSRIPYPYPPDKAQDYKQKNNYFSQFSVPHLRKNQTSPLIT